MDKSIVREKLVSLDLPSIVLELFDGRCPVPELSELCRDPYYPFTAGNTFPVNLLPVWERGVVITAVNPTNVKFSQISLECLTEPFFENLSLRGVTADLLWKLWEFEEPVECIRTVADLFQYNAVDELFEIFAEGPNGDYDAWRASWRET